MSGASNFLSRWSRRKRQAEEKEAPPDVESPRTTNSDSPATDGTDSGDAAPAELTLEELAALPRLEDLTAETDVAPFMRAGVPSGLRNAALRRIWALDPAIRDRVGDALDYAYDWNVPGGVPGSGQLLPVDDVKSMLRSIVGEPEPSSARQLETGSRPPTSEAQPALEVPSQQPVADPPASAAAAAEPPVLPDAASAEPKQKAGAEARPPRRHGSATPF